MSSISIICRTKPFNLLLKRFFLSSRISATVAPETNTSLCLRTITLFYLPAFFTDHSGEFDIAIRIYRGIFLFVLVTFLLALNTYGWRKAGVNHVLIFELDPRDHLSYQQLLEVN